VHHADQRGRVEQRGAHGPAMHRLVGDAHGAEMLLRVGIRDRIAIDEAKPMAQQFDIVLLAGQEQPPGSDAEVDPGNWTGS
jgi:hypothetical protein